jgi:hypothetical protein
MMAIIVAGGCTLGEIMADYGDPVDMQPSDLVGSWRSGQHRTITFDEDGTFTAAHLPYEVFDEFLPVGFDPARNIIGSGTWSLEAPDENPDGPRSTVALSIELADKLGVIGVELSALRQDGTVFLFFFYVGEGGNSWTAYQKCTPDCPAQPSSTRHT